VGEVRPGHPDDDVAQLANAVLTPFLRDDCLDSAVAVLRLAVELDDHSFVLEEEVHPRHELAVGRDESRLQRGRRKSLVREENPQTRHARRLSSRISEPDRLHRCTRAGTAPYQIESSGELVHRHELTVERGVGDRDSALVRRQAGRLDDRARNRGQDGARRGRHDVGAVDPAGVLHHLVVRPSVPGQPGHVHLRQVQPPGRQPMGGDGRLVTDRGCGVEPVLNGMSDAHVMQPLSFPGWAVGSRCGQPLRTRRGTAGPTGRHGPEA
jgi:hypothetical protein